MAKSVSSKTDLKSVPLTTELVVLHVLLHQAPDVGGEELLLEDDGLQLHTAVGGDCRGETGGEEEEGGDAERERPNLDQVINQCQTETVSRTLPGSRRAVMGERSPLSRFDVELDEGLKGNKVRKPLVANSCVF